MKNCIQCNIEFEPASGRQVYCSEECRHKHKYPHLHEEKSCRQCGEKFIGNSKTCSEECSEAYWAEYRRRYNKTLKAEKPEEYKMYHRDYHRKYVRKKDIEVIHFQAKNCLECNKKFQPISGRQKFCDCDCRQKYPGVRDRLDTLYKGKLYRMFSKMFHQEPNKVPLSRQSGSSFDLFCTFIIDSFVTAGYHNDFDRTYETGKVFFYNEDPESPFYFEKMRIVLTNSGTKLKVFLRNRQKSIYLHFPYMIPGVFTTR